MSKNLPVLNSTFNNATNSKIRSPPAARCSNSTVKNCKNDSSQKDQKILFDMEIPLTINECPCRSWGKTSENLLADNKESPELSAKNALEEMHEKAIDISSQYLDKQITDKKLNNVFVEEAKNIHHLVETGEKIYHEVHGGRQLTLMKLIKTDDQLKCFTGINFQLLSNLTNAVKDAEGEKESVQYCCSVEERIVLCLCKLKLNLSFKCLSVLFNISRQTCSNLFIITLHSLSFILEDAIYWPKKEEILKSMPKCFKNFKSTFIVLDCTEIPIEKPNCLYCRLRLYSHYKGCETAKILLGISPSGTIIYCSEAFGGRASDKSIFNYSNILEKLMPTRDSIMTDKGFEIEHECLEARIKLIMPPKLEQKSQFSPEEIEKTKKIAAARVHIERVNQRFKLFQIMRSKISLKIAPYLNEICKVICGIVNLSEPILNDNKF